MADYNREAMAETLKGLVTCGARCGYDGSKEFTLEEIIDVLDDVNREIVDAGLQSIPCILREGVLIGRTSTENYHEKVYSMEFSWSPRAKLLERTTFYNTLIEYANRIGQKMKQERVYLEFDGQTEVLKKID